jgi:hypothetical protein
VFELVVTAGPLAGRRIEVDRELVVGRVNSDLRIDDPEISRRHVAIRPVQGGIEVEDLGSLNGTIVNNLRISKPTHAVDGDVIEVGATQMRVEVGEKTIDATVVRPAAVRSEIVKPAGPGADPVAAGAAASPGSALPPPPGQPDPTPVAPSAAAPSVAATEVVSGVAVSYTYSGKRFLLGVGDGFYGIWDRAALTIPTRRFPQNDEGWAEAWRTFASWEPNAQRV